MLPAWSTASTWKVCCATLTVRFCGEAQAAKVAPSSLQRKVAFASPVNAKLALVELVTIGGLAVNVGAAGGVVSTVHCREVGRGDVAGRVLGLDLEGVAALRQPAVALGGCAGLEVARVEFAEEGDAALAVGEAEAGAGRGHEAAGQRARVDRRGRRSGQVDPVARGRSVEAGRGAATARDTDRRLGVVQVVGRVHPDDVAALAPCTCRQRQIPARRARGGVEHLRGRAEAAAAQILIVRPEHRNLHRLHTGGIGRRPADPGC